MLFENNLLKMLYLSSKEKHSLHAPLRRMTVFMWTHAVLQRIEKHFNIVGPIQRLFYYGM